MITQALMRVIRYTGEAGFVFFLVFLSGVTVGIILMGLLVLIIQGRIF